MRSWKILELALRQYENNDLAKRLQESHKEYELLVF